MPLVRAADPSAAQRPEAASQKAGSLADDLSGVDDADRLLDALREGPAGRRRAAARELMRYPEAAGRLALRLGEEADTSVRSAMVTALIAHRTHAAASGLLAYLCSEDVGLRSLAVEALGTMPDIVAPYVPAMLADPDSDVRIQVANLLALLAHPDVPGWLAQVVRTDPHVNVCAVAIDALAEAGAPDCETVLASVGDRFPEEPFIAFAARLALRRIRGR